MDPIRMKLIHRGVQRYDLGQIGKIEMTPQGFMKVPGFATRTGVFTYRDANGKVRRELRHPDDVFDPESLATLRNAPVTNEHPPVMINPANMKQYLVGYTTNDVSVNRDLVEIDLIIAEAKAMADIGSGKRELSAGYVADLDEEGGVYNGTPYDCKQVNIKYNHVALVDKGRAGPEVRLRLDSMDAEMVGKEIGGVLPTEAAAFEPEGENGDAERKDIANDQGGATKSIVISGEKVELPAHAAAVIEQMLDRYDLMRGELAKLQEDSEMDAKDKKDVDISQKGISPQMKVEQGAPDGRNASKKVSASDTEGAEKAKGMKDAEEDEKKKAKEDAEKDEKEAKDKKDYEGPGAGNAMSPVDMMKSQMQDMRDKMDGMQAKLDEYANKTIAGGEKKMDSADMRTVVRERVKLERQAEKILGSEAVARFDGLSDDEIRAEVIKKVRPNSDLKDKSHTYLQVRFDSIVEDFHEGETLRKEMGSSLLGGGRKNSRFDAEPTNPADKRREMTESTRAMWQQPLSASKGKH
jgi:uncharacterized protein